MSLTRFGRFNLADSINLKFSISLKCVLCISQLNFNCCIKKKLE